MKKRLSTGRTGTWGEKMIKKNTRAGISSVLVLGVIAVLLTIVVPLVSRTVVDIRITKQQEDQARAFSVAETGLEQAMVAGGTEAGEIDGIKYEVTKATVGGAGNFYAYPKVVERDSPVFIWLVEHDDDGNFDPESSPLADIGNAYRGSTLDFYWGEPGMQPSVEKTPALEATLYYLRSGEYRAQRFALDPNSSRRRSENSFDWLNPSAVTTRDGYAFRQRVTVPCFGSNTVCLAVSLRLLYNFDKSHPVAIAGAGTNQIPLQGQCFQSLAKSGEEGETGIASRVERCLFYRAFPSIFNFGVFAGGEIEKGSR